MTRREEKIVDSFAATPEAWLEALSETAYARWRAWLDENRERLTWDADERVFVEHE